MNTTTRPNTRTPLSSILTLILIGAVAITAVAGGEEEDLKWGHPPELNLAVVGPLGNEIALQDDGGFAITLHMFAMENRLLGIGKEAYPPTLPGDKTRGWIIFDDPDSCPSFISPVWQAANYVGVYCTAAGPLWPDCPQENWGPLLSQPCPPNDVPGYQAWIAQFQVDGAPSWDFDETWVEFFSGTSVPDDIPLEEQERRPEVWEHTTMCDPYPNCWPDWDIVGVGPSVGSTEDQTRYGRWDRLPGLVVIADAGPGLITHPPLDPDFPPYNINNPPIPGPTPSEFFDPPYPLKAWNLAGHFQSIGHTLLANRNAWPGWGRTTLTAQMVASNDLFKPVGIVDRTITNQFIDDNGTTCHAGDSAYRLDGGPVTCLPYVLNYFDPLTNDTLITVRIFIVNGDAPDIIEDMDGNGVLDIHDVEAMECAPLTNCDAITYQRTVRFYQISEMNCGTEYDFDGDGNTGQCIHGARAGGITGVPR